MDKETSDKLFNLVKSHNERVNITKITDYYDFLVKHVLDSELGIEFIVGVDVLDIGSGAGFPGLAIAINRPDLTVTMVDSVNKKVEVINDIALNLNLPNAKAIHTRIEDLEMKQAFDTVTARAVAPLNILAEYALPFLKIGGRFIAYKSTNTDKEIEEAKNAISILGGKISDIKDIKLDEATTRRFIIIEKIKPSPREYPRGKNLPRIKPL